MHIPALAYGSILTHPRTGLHKVYKIFATHPKRVWNILQEVAPPAGEGEGGSDSQPLYLADKREQHRVMLDEKSCRKEKKESTKKKRENWTRSTAGYKRWQENSIEKTWRPETATSNYIKVYQVYISNYSPRLQKVEPTRRKSASSVGDGSHGSPLQSD